MSDNTTESEQRKDSFVEQAFSDWFVENMYGNDPIYAKEKAEEAFKFAYDLANDSGKDSASGVRVNARVMRLEGELEDGTYKNRLGEIRVVMRDDFLEDYPFRDKQNTAYDENGKVYKNRESDFDLVEAV